MIRYTYAGGQYPRGGYVVDGVSNAVIVWRASGSGGETPEPPVVVETPTQGMGPGWNLFQALPGKKRRVDTLREELEQIVSKALGEDVAEPEAQEQAIAATAAIVREIDSSGYLDLRGLADAIAALGALDLQARAYFERLQAALEEQRAREADDLEAFMMIARLA